MVKTDTTTTTIVAMAAAGPPHTSHATEPQKIAGTIANATVERPSVVYRVGCLC